MICLTELKATRFPLGKPSGTGRTERLRNGNPAIQDHPSGGRPQLHPADTRAPWLRAYLTSAGGDLRDSGNNGGATERWSPGDRESQYTQRWSWLSMPRVLDLSGLGSLPARRHGEGRARHKSHVDNDLRRLSAKSRRRNIRRHRDRSSPTLAHSARIAQVLGHLRLADGTCRGDR